MPKIDIPLLAAARARNIPLVTEPAYVDERDARGFLWDLDVADEDRDPIPPPTGCPQCWLTGGGRCTRCPDRNRATRSTNDRL